MDKWEYLTFKQEKITQKELNDLGSESWELIIAFLNNHNKLCLVFKRPKLTN